MAEKCWWVKGRWSRWVANWQKHMVILSVKQHYLGRLGVLVVWILTVVWYTAIICTVPRVALRAVLAANNRSKGGSQYLGIFCQRLLCPTQLQCIFFSLVFLLLMISLLNLFFPCLPPSIFHFIWALSFLTPPVHAWMTHLPKLPALASSSCMLLFHV